MRLPRLTSRADDRAASTAGVESSSSAHASAGPTAAAARPPLASGVRRRGRALVAASAALCVVGMLAGCETRGLLSPNEVGVAGGHQTEPLIVPILEHVDPVAEGGNTEFVNAAPPTPRDLETRANDYTISPNDLLQIGVSDLMGPGVESTKASRVTESGNISLPYLGAVHAEGLTELELEQAIVAAYRQANLVANAQVTVTVLEARGRTVEILGAVNQPGQFAILDPEFRLMNALVLARGVNNELIDYLYIIRRSENHPAASSTGAMPPTPQMINPATPGPGSGGPGPLRPGPGPASAPTPDDLAPRGQIQRPEEGFARDLTANRPLALLAQAPGVTGGDDLAPGSTTAPTTNAATTTAGAVTVPPSRTTTPTSATPPAGAGTQPFEFNAPQGPGSVRVIRIPYQALRNGDLNFNVAIRPHDIIIAQQSAIGEYYMGGHVARPGVYSLTGRKVTLKQACISAGMFDELAIPQRTEIIRRIKPDREVYVRIDLDRIFAGQQPDLFLKPDDQIMVGTNAIAPFLAALRGSFRFTYGFGFLYDRNYAYSSNGNSF